MTFKMVVTKIENKGEGAYQLDCAVLDKKGAASCIAGWFVLKCDVKPEVRIDDVVEVEIAIKKIG